MICKYSEFLNRKAYFTSFPFKILLFKHGTNHKSIYCEPVGTINRPNNRRRTPKPRKRHYAYTYFNIRDDCLPMRHLNRAGQQALVAERECKLTVY